MNSDNNESTGEFILYQTEDGKTRLEVRFQGETVRLSKKQMAELFQKDVRTIGYDPSEEASQRFFATVQNKMHWAAHGQSPASPTCAKPGSRRTSTSSAPNTCVNQYWLRYSHHHS